MCGPQENYNGDLQQARREAAERFYAVAMAHLPEGWTYKFRKSLTGRCYYTTKHIDAPKPVTRKALYIWLHECAHAKLHADKPKSKTSHRKEYEAEQWAHDRMRENDIAVPREMTVRAKDYVKRKITRALKCGAKNIDAKALKFSRS